jgi:hypothetical protein
MLFFFLETAFYVGGKAVYGVRETAGRIRECG